jgi:long-subunit acyl-CoA synthetase (AMP-forming)
VKGDEVDETTEGGTMLDEANGGPAIEPEFSNLYEAFVATVDRIPDDTAIVDDSLDVTLTWSELGDRVRATAGGYRSLGLGPSKTIAFLMRNRADFIPSDLAAVSIGALPFSIYSTSSDEQIEYLLSDSKASVAVVESEHAPRFMELRDSLPDLEHVVTLDGEGGTMTIEDLLAVDPDFDPGPFSAEVDLESPLTLIYTSGTTGPPKGVTLTHGNLLRMLTGVTDQIIRMPDRGAKVISWLPAAHIAERGANYYTPVMQGLEVHICPDPKRVVEYLAKVKPTWFFAVPRIWEKLKAGLEANLAGLPEEQRVPAQAGLEAGLQKIRLEQAGEPVPAEIEEAVARADEALFSKLRAALGLDEFVAVSVSAAPIPVEVLEFFHAIGIPIGELWGMSETCGVITINPPDRIKIGTVGPPAPGVEVKVAEDGELLCRSPYVMTEYRNMPDKTSEAIIDGWLHTGDIGSIDEEGYVTILDRKKELIINAAGKNMSPANIEAHVKAASPLVNQCVAIGNGRPYNSALIVLDPDFAPVWASQNGLEGMTLEDLATQEAVIDALGASISVANEKLSRVEQIKRFLVIPGEWAPGGDELTPTMKLKRKPIDSKYEDRIEALYSGEVGTDVGG